MDENSTNETPVTTYHFRVGFDFTITSPRPLDSIDWSAIRANAINTLEKMDENEFYYSILKIKED